MCRQREMDSLKYQSAAASVSSDRDEAFDLPHKVGMTSVLTSVHYVMPLCYMLEIIYLLILCSFDATP